MNGISLSRQPSLKLVQVLELLQLSSTKSQSPEEHKDIFKKLISS